MYEFKIVFICIKFHKSFLKRNNDIKCMSMRYLVSKTLEHYFMYKCLSLYVGVYCIDEYEYLVVLLL